jgi:hypothetical protein
MGMCKSFLCSIKVFNPKILQETDEENMKLLELYLKDCRGGLLREYRDALVDSLIRCHIDASIEFVAEHPVR